jgi:hypothetical protein
LELSHKAAGGEDIHIQKIEEYIMTVELRKYGRGVSMQ